MSTAADKKIQTKHAALVARSHLAGQSSREIAAALKEADCDVSYRTVQRWITSTTGRAAMADLRELRQEIKTTSVRAPTVPTDDGEGWDEYWEAIGVLMDLGRDPSVPPAVRRGAVSDAIGHMHVALHRRDVLVVATQTQTQTRAGGEDAG